jgi:hypothetical protein
VEAPETSAVEAAASSVETSTKSAAVETSTTTAMKTTTAAAVKTTTTTAATVPTRRERRFGRADQDYRCNQNAKSSQPARFFHLNSSNAAPPFI